MHIPVLSDNLNYFILIVIIVVIIKTFLFIAGPFFGKYVIVQVVKILWGNNFEHNSAFLYVGYSHTLEVVV
jgi:hypothetical protein